MTKPFITVFTPTYNRANTLLRTYNSLCRQTNHNFKWLIIDDGSTDNTRQLALQWQRENIIAISYIHKENGGLHTGYNCAFANIDTELNICIDSDDFMPDNAIEIIFTTWQKCKANKHLAGIIGLDFNMEGEPIGGYFNKVGDFHIHEMAKFHQGDTKIVCRTDVIKPLAPMPVFKGERNFNPIYYYIQLDKNYKFRLLNENLCNVEYQPTGMSANIIRQYRNSPKSFAQLRRLCMSMPYYSIGTHFRNAIHYVSSCILSKQWNGLKKSPRPFLCAAAIPFGILLTFYVLFKTRKQ